MRPPLTASPNGYRIFHRSSQFFGGEDKLDQMFYCTRSSHDKSKTFLFLTLLANLTDLTRSKAFLFLTLLTSLTNLKSHLVAAKGAPTRGPDEFREQYAERPDKSIGGTRNQKRPPSHRLLPAWQSVVPDTVARTSGSSIVTNVPLFGSDGPNWRLDSDDGVYNNLTAKVPGDILSDLMSAGYIDDPYIDRNFLTQQHVWMGERNLSSSKGETSDPQEETLRQRTRQWTYSTQFELETEVNDSYDNSSTPRANLDQKWMLVVAGIKMGASVSFNGVFLGDAVDQFVRYTWILNEEDHLSKGNLMADTSKSSLNNTIKRRRHKLSISFDPSIGVDGRFTPCSGGWDWSPYTQAGDSQGRRVFTFGIAKPIYLVPVEHFAIMDVVPKTYYQGPYPREIMSDGPKADFAVLVDVHLKYTSIMTSGEVSKRLWVAPGFADSQQQPVSTALLSSQEHKSRGDTVIVTFNMTASKDDIQLWWPNGLGGQPLYDILVGISDDTSNLAWGIRKRIGFRTAALVTVNDTDDAVMAGVVGTAAEGSGQHGMFFRINGAVLLAKGANFIPMDQLEGRLSDEAHRIAVQSAARSNMNMQRIWGGGMVLPDAFYDACDEEGILLYHDMMFAQEGHSPIRTDTVEQELRGIVRSLSPHPSIVLWNGCNECSVVMGTETDIYATFVMQTVAEEDDTRAIWPSSPSKLGWKFGVYTLDGRPNGKSLATWNPKDFHVTLESHGPYQRSYSATYPGVNGCDTHSPYDNTPPRLAANPVGPQFQNLFASEFGASVMSSFESMSGTLSREIWGLHGGSPPDTCQRGYGNYNICEGNNTMAQRNYPCDAHIEASFGETVSLDLVGEVSFQAQLYMCMMAQTLWMKGEIEKRRSRNSFGLLIWQLNENWPTGGWGAIEYGTKGPGQVVGGRWKPLMHLFESSLYRDVFAACGQGDQCYIRNDGIQAANLTVFFEAWTLSALQVGTFVAHEAYLDTFSIDRFSLPPSWHSSYDVVLIRVKDNGSSNIIQESVFLWDLPIAIEGLQDPAVITVCSIDEGKNGTAIVSLISNKLALFVYLTTKAQGRFADNAFVILPTAHREVTFVPMGRDEAVDMELLVQTLRVEHLGSYMVPKPALLIQ